jgi:hypothetical protein
MDSPAKFEYEHTGWDRHDCVSNLLSKVGLCGFLHLGKDHCRNLLWGL